MSRMYLRGLGNLCSSTVYNQWQVTIILTPFRAAYHQSRLTIELMRQAHNRLLRKANENVANQQKHKFYKRWRHKRRHRGPPVKLAPDPLPFNPTLCVAPVFCFYVYANMTFLVWFNFDVFDCVHNPLQVFVKVTEQDTALTLRKK